MPFQACEKEEGLMDNLETLGLFVLFAFLTLSGGYYLFSRKDPVQDKIPLPDKHDDFETGEEVFPLVQFPPEAEQEPIPELPWGYNDDKLTIMARDPEWIFAYWDIGEQRRSSLRHSIGPLWDSSQPVLRVHDVTGISYFDGANSNQHFDVAVDDYSGNWYVHPGGPNKKYCAELGRILSDGTFVMMARSNFASTPPNGISDKTDPEWMLVSEKEKKLYNHIGYPTGISSGEMFNRQ